MRINKGELVGVIKPADVNAYIKSDKAQLCCSSKDQNICLKMLLIIA